MDERDLEPEEAAARLLVDQLRPVRLQARELGGDILDLEGDVVEARSSLGEEPADRRVRPERGEQLDPRRTDEERRRLDALLVDALAVLERRAEEGDVQRDRGVEVVDGDADVVDSVRGDARTLVARVDAERPNHADGVGRAGIGHDVAEDLYELFA